MKKILVVDKYLIESMQAAYLWLWDRTGVYVASVLFALIVGHHVCYGPLKPLDFALLAIAGTWAGYLYVAQAKDLRQLNSIQRGWRDSPLRLCSVALSAFMLADAAFTIDAWHCAGSILWLAFNYFACVLVRDRKPKDLFSTRKLANAAT